GLGLWYALARRRWLEGAAIVLGGLAISLVAIEVVIPHFNHAGTSSFFSRYSQVGCSASGILHTAVTHPWKAVTTAFTGRGLGYRLGAIPVWRYFPAGETAQAYATRITEHDRIAAKTLKLIPPPAVVSATNSLGAPLSARRRVLSFPIVRDATWIAADETKPG